MKRLVSLLLCGVFCLTGCSTTVSDEEAFLASVRQEALKYSFLTSCDVAVYSLQEMFGMWDVNTYSQAKKSAKLAKELHGVWFPTAHWLGNDVTNQSKSATIERVSVSSVSDEYQEGVLQVRVKNNVTSTVTVYLYRFSYHIASDSIVALEELINYKDWG